MLSSNSSFCACNSVYSRSDLLIFVQLNYSYDYSISSDFLHRPNKSAGPQTGDYVAIRDKSPPSTLSPRFHGNFKVSKRFGNSVVLVDGRQINLHDIVLVKRS